MNKLREWFDKNVLIFVYKRNIYFGFSCFRHHQKQNEDTDHADSAGSERVARQSSQSRQSSSEEASTTDSSQTTNLEAGLPTGWTMQVAPNGRMFFIDHNERKTSWVDPRTGRASPMPSQTRPPEDDLGSLPEGWEERVHADGRIFFIDHSMSRTTFSASHQPILISQFYALSRHANHTVGGPKIVESKYCRPSSTLL